MLKINVYNLKGETVGEMKLSDDIFSVEPKQDVLHQVVLACLANRRGPYAHTKTKGEVRGGGRKPWKQKGTGRARHGSNRSPIWVGGGITFGPRSERDYTVKVNKKVKDKALCMLLTDKLKNNEIIVVDKFDLKEPKTKLFAGIVSNLLKNINKQTKDKGLLLAEANKNIKLASRNLKNLTSANGVNFGFLDAMNSQYIIFEKAVLEALEKKFKK
ncbi:MAG: 50S ribosomal protein L4 [bacterium]